MSAGVTRTATRPGLWAHMRALWPRWTLLPAAPFVLWCLYCLGRGERRWELVALLIFVPAMVYGNARTKKLYFGLLPFGLVGLLYDSMRFTKNLGLTAARVHVGDLRAIELRYFGVTLHDGMRITLHDWFLVHHTTWADLYFAIPYGIFLFVPLAYAVYLYFRDFRALQRYSWTFFLLNVAGFITYHLYPAAPPWYFHAHGDVVDLTAHASAGAALTRVDQWLGIPYFVGLYGRSNDVFGAVPSLHVVYPLLIVLEGWRLHRWPGRLLTLVYWLSTCCAAVYLDHHWVVDIVVGLTYTALIYVPMRKLLPPLPATIESPIPIAPDPELMKPAA